MTGGSEERKKVRPLLQPVITSTERLTGKMTGHNTIEEQIWVQNQKKILLKYQPYTNNYACSLNFDTKTD